MTLTRTGTAANKSPKKLRFSHMCKNWVMIRIVIRIVIKTMPIHKVYSL